MEKENLLVCDCEEREGIHGQSCECFFMDENGDIVETKKFREITLRKD